MRKPLRFYSDHYDLAKSYKSATESTNNEILQYTDPVMNFSTQALTSYKREPIHSVIVESVTTFKNFVTHALFGVKTKWAKSDVIMSLLIKEYGNDPDVLETERKRLIREMDQQTDEIFQFILNSNYEKEVGRAIYDWGELGTGAFKYIEQNSVTYPFRQEHVPLNELVFNEDFRGKPELVFRHYFKKRPDTILELFPELKDTNFMSKFNEQTINEEIDVIECIIPFEDLNVKETDSREKVSFERLIFTDGMTESLYSEVMNYNPYTIARFRVLPNNPWGTGIGHTCLDAYKRINFYERLRSRQALRIVEPPIAAMGDKELIEMMNFEPNSVNYMGDGQYKQLQTNIINTTGTLMPLEKDIERFTTIIQNAHFNNPFGSVDNKTTRASNEIQNRMELFKQQFSDATSNLYEEILKPTYQKPKQILLDKNIVEPLEAETQAYFQAQFVNLLTQSADMSQIDVILQARQLLQFIFPTEAEFVFNIDKTIAQITEAMRIPERLIIDADTRKQLVQERQQQLEALQQLASAQRNTAETNRLNNANMQAL